MDNTNTTNNATQHSCCSGGCSATDSHNKVEKVESYEEAQSRRSYAPTVDIIDAKDATTLVLDLPGVDEKNVDISVEKNILTIKGRQADPGFEQKSLVYSEYGTGDYHRTFVLSEDVDKDGIGATLKDGVLRVRLPKAQQVTKKITVGPSASA